MPKSLAAPIDLLHPVCGEEQPRRMAKATLESSPLSGERLEMRQKEAHGRLLRTVQHVLGESRKSMAARLGIDERQLGRWYDGTETAQLWRYHRDLLVRRALRLVEGLDDAEGSTVEIVIKSRLDLGTRTEGEQ